MSIWDDALASVRSAELDAAQGAALDQIGQALGTIESLQAERDSAVSERNELLGKYTALLETNMRLAMAQTPRQAEEGTQAKQEPSTDPYANVPKWDVSDLYGKKE